MKKSNLIITITIFVMLFLLIAQAVVSNRLSTGGLLLEETEEQIQFYKTQNDLLKERVLSESSLGYVSLKAQEIGFVGTKSTFVLKTSLPLAVRP